MRAGTGGRSSRIGRGRRARGAARFTDALTAAALAVTLAACGSGGAGAVSIASPTPVVQPTPVAPGAIAAMLLGGRREVATSVNGRGWITLLSLTALSRQPVAGRIVLAPDAGPDAGPVPVPGCPLAAQSDGCAVGGDLRVVGESDWVSGYTYFVASNLRTPLLTLFGPQGEVVPLEQLGDELGLTDVKPSPGELFVGLGPLVEGDDTRHLRPYLFRAPGFVREQLPLEGFSEGPWPQQVSATGRIVGSGIDPSRPVRWEPSDGGYVLSVLPLLDGGKHGGAQGIAGDLVVGWSDDAEGEHAVLWTVSGASVAIAVLPVAAGAASCTRALAISAGRIVGACASADGTPLAVLWAQGDGSASWSVTRLLPPLPGGTIARVVALSGDLAVGSSEDAAGVVQPVAWRLPAEPSGD